MNLLLTNTHAPQAYDLMRALRPYANKIVVTMEGDSRVKARLSPPVNSRLVDKRYYTPAPVHDWQSGNIRSDNTATEEAFIQAVLQICEKEQITVIYPSWDPYVYVLSKNKARFEKLGIIIPVPDFDITINAIDKYRTVRMAEEVGVPAPHTYLYQPDLDLKWVAEKEGFPLVIKQRFTSGSKGLVIAKNYPELLQHLPREFEPRSTPMIQEYIPGGSVSSVQFVADKDGEIKFTFHKKKVRKQRLTSRNCAVSQSAKLEPYVEPLIRLVKRIGFWGSLGIETMLDPRDDVQKIMEINPRYPPQIWNRLDMGINEPLMCIKLAQDQSVATVADYPIGVLFICPINDLQLLALDLIDRMLYTFRTSIQGRAPIDQYSQAKPFTEQIEFFLHHYRSAQPKIYDPYFRNFFQDPLVAMLRWLQAATWVANGLKSAGK